MLSSLLWSHITSFSLGGWGLLMLLLLAPPCPYSLLPSPDSGLQLVLFCDLSCCCRSSEFTSQRQRGSKRHAPARAHRHREGGREILRCARGPRLPPQRITYPLRPQLSRFASFVHSLVYYQES